MTKHRNTQAKFTAVDTLGKPAPGLPKMTRNVTKDIHVGKSCDNFGAAHGNHQRPAHRVGWKKLSAYLAVLSQVFVSKSSTESARIETFVGGKFVYTCALD